MNLFFYRGYIVAVSCVVNAQCVIYVINVYIIIHTMSD